MRPGCGGGAGRPRPSGRRHAARHSLLRPARRQRPCADTAGVRQRQRRRLFRRPQQIP
ncbi:Hypothetical Protein RRSL_00500 [Ralstonia solanacearum UW551]|uniref:Uncharacterized protein n=1 Tax=Ralstonia solanacearum (strain UW551) TaxID=342110 RepID=A0AB33VFF3_RALSU|nr:Hypothetical Protein RRSL_00500 [Ralstonia solanacearum UW551]